MACTPVRPSSVFLAIAIAFSGIATVSGQNYRQRGISPIFDGWETLQDGTRLFYFGYINRNPEPVTIPVGPANNFEPGPADRNQPTHFLPGRHEHVFTIKPPANFKGKLVWTVNSEMGVQAANASFNQLYILEERENEDPNAKPPEISLGAISAKAGDPVALSPAIKPASAGGQVVLEGAATEAAGLNVNWSKYRGPGTVTFSAAPVASRGGVPPAATGARGAAGRARGRGAAGGAGPAGDFTSACGGKPAPGCGAALARFSEPGVYVLRAAARQDGMQGLAFVTVTVK